MKESQIQRQVLDWLAAKGILAFRMNTGAMAGEYKGKSTFMRFGTVGMADILAFHKSEPIWLEIKNSTGKQSEFQKSFQKQVELYGHRYILARSLDDVIDGWKDA